MEHGSPVAETAFAERQSDGMVRNTLDARLFRNVTLGCVAVIGMLGLAVAYLDHARDEGLHRLILRAFLLDEEANLPTFFAFGLLIFCSILLVLTAMQAFSERQKFRFHWAFLAAVFFILAFDEAASVHERFNFPLRTALGTTGWMYFAWVIPALVLVAVLAMLYLPLLRNLPKPCGLLFFLSGVLYVGGAVGVEMPGAAYYEAHGGENLTYLLITTVEEMLEMLGLTVFAYALIRNLAHGRGTVCIAFQEGSRQ